MITWTSEKRKISELIPASYNPRELTEKQAKDLSTSLGRFNLADPIVINTNNRIVGGHQRINILKQSGDMMVDVRVPSRELTEHEEQELNIRLNKNLGQWDLDALANFDEEMLKDIGFDSKELDKIFQLDAKPEDDDVPEVRTTDIKLGDMFQLGEHRLLCGDSTQRADVERLMQGEKADMVFTSPPYNLGVSAKLSGNTNIGKKGNCYEDYNDNQSENSWLELMTNFFCVWIDYSEYICVNVQSLAGNRKALWQFINSQVDYFCDVAIWNKDFGAPAMAHRVMNSCFEFIFLFTKNNPTRAIRTADFRGTVKNVFDIPPQRKNDFSDIHGATFPVELPIKIIESFTQREMTIADCFGGSGSTIIACEKLNRKCRMMEISPKYCEVIATRYENFSGNKRIKL